MESAVSAQDIEPCANETARPHRDGDRHRRPLPPARRRRLAGLAEPPALARRRRLRRDLRADRPGHHRRLSSPLHAPGVRDEQAGARDARDPRHRRDRGADHRLGRRSPQAPRVLRPVRRSAQPARRPRPGPARRAARPRPRARRLAVPAHPARQQEALRARPRRRPADRASSTARRCCGSRSGWPRRSASATRSAAR